MSLSRCVLAVKGLDCATEAESLRAALQDLGGISALGFDLIYGTMSVEFDPELVDPQELVRLIAERTGLQATVQSNPASAPAPPALATAVSRWWGPGWPWSLGLAFSWLGPALGLDHVIAERLALSCYVATILIAGIELFPRAARNLWRLRLDIDVLMGLAVLGAMGLGQWDEAATVAFLFGLSEALEALSLDARGGRSGPCWRSRRPRPSGSAPTARSRPCRRARCARAIGSWSAPATRSRSTATVVVGPVERRPEDDHRRVGARAPRAGRPGLRRDGQRRGHSGGRGRRARSSDA